MTGPPSRPVPVPDETSAPYWEAAARGHLVLARCSRCQRFSHPPGPVCPHCHATDHDPVFEQVAGSGTIRSWTTVHRSSLGGFDGDGPFTLVDVAVDGADDVRLIGRLVDGPDVPLTLGDRVVLAFEHLDDGVAVPAFTLAAR